MSVVFDVEALAVKTLRERIDRAIQRITNGHGAMSVPADMTDPDIVLDACRRHIDGEPERLVAAVAREREEQREADVRSCPTCKGEGFTMRVRECPFCDDSTHDHECPTDEVKVYCACGAARLRATPLTATPLKDENKALRERVAELKVQLAERVDRHDRDGLALIRYARERDEAVARAKGLETAAREEQREALGLDRWPTLIPFVAAMARKLDANKAKKGGREGWQNQEPGGLVRRVIEEAEELEHAVDTKGAREILLEAADVANMAMMVADASGALDAMPLTATPQADRIAELERQGDVVRRELAAALERIDGAITDWVDLRAVTARMKDERDTALARVKELEGALLASCREKVLHGHTTMLLTDALRLKVPGVENYEDWGAERRSKLREAEAERDALKAQLAEAVEAVTAALAVTNNAAHVMGCLADPDDHPACCWIDQCRAFLAKYPEGR